MDPISPVPQTPTPDSNPQQPPVVPPLPKKNNVLLWILLLVLLFGSGWGLYLTARDQGWLPTGLSPIPTPATTSTPIPTPDITGGWSEYLNEETGIRLKHPAMDTTCCAIDVANNKLLATFAVASTVAPSTDKPFDGFAIAVADMGNQTWSQFISTQKNILTGAYQVYGTTPTGTQDMPVTVDGQQGLWLKGYSTFRIEYLYIPFSDGKRVLVFGKNNESPGSFDTLFSQILSTFKFLDTVPGNQ